MKTRTTWLCTLALLLGSSACLDNSPGGVDAAFRDQILGTWIRKDYTSPLIDVTPDSVYYINPDAGYAYTLRADSIYLQDEAGQDEGFAIKLTGQGEKQKLTLSGGKSHTIFVRLQW